MGDSYCNSGKAVKTEEARRADKIKHRADKINTYKISGKAVKAEEARGADKISTYKISAYGAHTGAVLAA